MRWHGDGIAGATRSLCRLGVIAGVDRNASVPQAAAKDVDLALGQTVTEAFAAQPPSLRATAAPTRRSSSSR